MGVEWGLIAIDPRTNTKIEDATFDPHPFDLSELDAVSCGSWNGPLRRLVDAAERLTDDLDCHEMRMSAELVRDLGERLISIERDDFAPKLLVLEQSAHTMDKRDEQSFYEHVVEMACSLQDFVRTAIQNGWALQLEVY